MVKNQKGISLVNLILIVIIILFFITIIIKIFTGENGLLNQWKDEATQNKTNYVIKMNETNENAQNIVFE